MEIKTYEEACAQKGLDPVAILPDVSKFPVKHQKALTATAKMYIIAPVLNDDWEPDWNDDDEEKWIPWMDMEVDKNNPTGFRFCDTFYAYANTFSASGSRLCYRTRALAKYAAETFLDLYRDMMVILK